MPEFCSPYPFAFGDYHALFRSWYQARREETGLTLREFAELLGEKHRAFPHGVMSEGRHQKRLQPTRARSWAEALGWSVDEVAYVVLLAMHEEAEREVSLREARLERADTSADRQRLERHLASSRQALDELSWRRNGWRRLAKARGPRRKRRSLEAELERPASQADAARLVVRGEEDWFGPPGWEVSSHALFGDALARLHREGTGFRDACRFHRLIQAMPESRLLELRHELLGFAAELAGRAPRQGATSRMLLDLHVFPLTQPVKPGAVIAASPWLVPWDIFEHDTVRSCLDAWFDTVELSYGEFAALAGLKDRTLPRKVRLGKEVLTPALALDFAHAMELTDDERDYLVLLAASQVEDPEQRQRVRRRLQGARVLDRSRRVQRDAMVLCRNWEHWVIAELAQLGAVHRDGSGLGEALVPQLTRAQTVQAIEALVRLNVLEVDEQGLCRPRAKAWEATAVLLKGALSEARRDGHKRLHQRTALDLQHPGEGAIRADLLLPVVPGDWARVRERCDAFARHLLGFCSGGEEPSERVFHLGLLIAPCAERQRP